jgi:CheY-like chemotaxis protein
VDSRPILERIAMKILLVDNDPVYLNLMSEVLSLHSHTVVKATDGEAALCLLHTEAVDLIISDISMPKMNGMSLHRYVRENPALKHLPFAWNSGYRELRDAVEPDDLTVDFKLDKAMPIPRLLHFLHHVEFLMKDEVLVPSRN